jgi:hypothetical protein
MKVIKSPDVNIRHKKQMGNEDTRKNDVWRGRMFKAGREQTSVVAALVTFVRNEIFNFLLFFAPLAGINDGLDILVICGGGGGRNH